MTDTDEKEAEVANRISRILVARAKGQAIAAIAEAEGMSERQVARDIASAAAAVKKANEKLVNSRYLEHDARCEYLYQLCMESIHKDFDEKVVRAAVAVLDRQARLHGLDAVKRVGGKPGPHEWIDEAPIKDIMSEAKRLGIPIPTAFDTGV